MVKVPVPILDFSAWAELPYLHPGPHEDAELSTQLLVLVDKLRSAKAPLSGHYQRCPEHGIWGFGVADFTRHLDPADEMGVLVKFFRDLSHALSTPQEWLGEGPHNSNRVTTCRSYIEIGLHLIRHFAGEMIVTVRSAESGASEKIELHVNQGRLQTVQGALKMPHEASEMEYEAQIFDVDLDRGIALSSMGVLQIQDPAILVMCYERIGQWCTILVDTAASAIRIIVPELLEFSPRK
jgi:hypothetical protein